jgi:hypothetical protein
VNGQFVCCRLKLRAAFSGPQFDLKHAARRLCEYDERCNESASAHNLSSLWATGTSAYHGVRMALGKRRRRHKQTAMWVAMQMHGAAPDHATVSRMWRLIDLETHQAVLRGCCSALLRRSW